MDNIYLLTEIRGRLKSNTKILESQYKYGMILIGISLLKELEEKGEESVYEKIYETTKAISPVLLPMISTLGTLEKE